MLRWCVVAVGIVLTSPALAGPFEDGVAAAYRGDYGTAARLWRPLAESGVAIAQNNLGALYARGWGVKKDDLEANKWYRAAAEQGLADAESNIGYQYERGAGVGQDYGEAVMWYKRAAEQGHAGAEFSLGLMFAGGTGVPQDSVTAFMWLGLASAQGNTGARQALAGLIQGMTPEEIAEGQRRQIEARVAGRNSKAPAQP